MIGRLTSNRIAPGLVFGLELVLLLFMEPMAEHVLRMGDLYLSVGCPFVSMIGDDIFTPIDCIENALH